VNVRILLLGLTIGLSLVVGRGRAAIIETLDAGDLPATAMSTGTGILDAIQGQLAPGHDIDVFLIKIVSPALFFATTVSPNTDSSLGTQLFLFEAAGKAGVANDDDDAALFLSTIPVGYVASAGIYYLAIAEFPDLPTGGAVPIFPFDFGTVTASSASSLDGWLQDPGPLFGGNYEILLGGAEGAQPLAPVPEPSALVSLSLILSLAAVRFRFCASCPFIAT